jgi:hypothetical protein
MIKKKRKRVESKKIIDEKENYSIIARKYLNRKRRKD